MILGTTNTRILIMGFAMSVLFAGWAFGDDFTDTLDNAKESYNAGEVKDTRLFVQDLLKILDDQEALLMTKCVNEEFSPQWKAEEANIQTGDGGGLGKGGVSLDQRFTTEEGKSRGSSARGSAGGGAKEVILPTQGYVTLKIKKGGGNLENMLGGLGNYLVVKILEKADLSKLERTEGILNFRTRTLEEKSPSKLGRKSMSRPKDGTLKRDNL